MAKIRYKDLYKEISMRYILNSSKLNRKEISMSESYSIEKGLEESRLAFEELLGFVTQNADSMEAHNMEKGIFQKVLQIGLAAMKTYFAAKGTGEVGKSIENPKGQQLAKERIRTVNYFSIFGKLTVDRTCYRNAGSPGICPLDFEANLPDRCYSYFLQEMMGYYSLKNPFSEVVETFYKYFGHSFSPRSVEQVNRELSASYDEFCETQEPPAPETEGEIQVVSFDGKGVPMVKKELAEPKARLGRGEKRQTKKEALVGVSYTVDRKIRTPEEVAENLVRDGRKPEKSDNSAPRAQNKRVLASLKRAKKEVMKKIKADAERRNPDGNRPLVCLVDGARSLWMLIRSEFPDAVFILDIIHVLEYLWEAVYVYHPEGSAEAKEWVRSHLLKILKGDVGLVIRGLKITRTRRKLKKSHQATLDKVIRYLSRNRRGMRYDEYLSAGYPIGTGVVESACGHVVKDRMEGAGMRWTMDGAEATLLLRSVFASADWDDYMLFHTTREKQRLYGPEPYTPPKISQKRAA
jgi:hypothetical protein